MKTALVTGANKGIGWEVTRQLARIGYFVYLGCRNREAGTEAVKTLKAEGRENVGLIILDVTDAESVRKAAIEITQRTSSLDVLVNNAGILGTIPSSGESITVEETQRVFDTNFFGAIRVTRAFVPLLRKSEAACIVNVTSGLGSLTLQSDPTWKFARFKNAAYVPSKSALNAFTVVLAHELKDTHIKVNAIDPGYTATSFNRFTGEKKPEDAAATIVRYATLGVDGPTGGFFSEDGEVPW
jgi:NAD(P)-dependent dehydrogenase (short-subunit alcohol dehydrogenase family)